MDGGKKSTPMDQAAKSRIMSAEATKPGAGGEVQKDSFGATAQAAADKNASHNYFQKASVAVSAFWACCALVIRV